MSAVLENKISMLRHTVATLAYRGGKTLRGVTAEFASFRAAPGIRTPAEILAHIGDLLDWALALAEGGFEWHDSAPLPWEEGTAGFHAALAALDRRLESSETLKVPAESLFQGPIADALTHVGQIAMLRRMAGSPIRGENYFKAEIVAGRTGPEQRPAKKEFD
jgi:hypothetical protein